MLKRTLFFSTPYCLSLRNGQMIIHTREAPDQRKSIPIEDIGFVVLEDQQTSITLPLLNALSDNNVAVIFCGENRMPNAMLSNLDSNRTLRAAVARAIMGSGLFPAFGIFHRNRYNAFPLADDLMEPYRPYVDEIVYRLYTNGHMQLTQEVKGELLRILFVDTRFDKTVRPLEVGLTFTTSSIAKCFAGIQKKAAYPLLE